MLKLFLAVAVALTLSGAAHAQCTPEGNARFMATERRIQAAAARIRAGDCAAITEWRSASAAQHAILLRSQRQTYPYTCTVTFKNPSPPRCPGDTAAKSAAEKKQTAANQGTPLGRAGKRSCSDITGTNSKAPAARACNEARTALSAAEAAHKKDPSKSAEAYKNAAQAYRKAGDSGKADAVLKAAGLLVVAAASTASAETSGASKPSSGTTAADGGYRIMWSGRKEDCDKASLMEQNTAGWYDMCVEQKATASQQKTHTPSIDPKILFQRARETCKNEPIETRQRCITDAKIAILMAEDLAVRSECGATTGDERIVCVHGAYLYGPGGSDRAERQERERSRRIELEQRIAALPGSSSVPSEYPGSPEILRDRCREPGTGMKPTPGAFGAWSCQPLGMINLGADRPKSDAQVKDGGSGAAADRGYAFEKSVVETAAKAAVAAAGTSGASMPTPDREACMIAAFGAAYAVLKGGAPAVTDQCRPMTQAARAELIAYAVARIDTRSNPGVEELLSVLAEQGDQIAGANASPSSAARVANDCTRAETHWKSAEEIRTLAAYEDHLARFLGCEFATLAAARIQALKK